MSSPDLPLVLLTHPIPQEWLTRLNGICRLVTGQAGTAGFSDCLMEKLPDCDGILCLLTDRIDAGLLDQAPRLRAISNYAAGLDNIDLKACTAGGIPVGHTPGILTEATADLAMALLLAAARGILPAARDAAEGRWLTWSPGGWLGRDLFGATLGIIGLGKIGAAVAKRAAGFGMRIIYTNSEAVPGLEKSLGLQMATLDSLMAESDFISVHVPLTSQTRGMFNREAFNQMKAGVILVNTARGSIIDMDALADALETGRISGAALDVTDPEPLPPEHRLYRLPNCLIVPHIGSATHGTRRGMADLACRNLAAGLAGERMPACANPEVYR